MLGYEAARMKVWLAADLRLAKQACTPEKVG
jgi:hypothetical protein